MTLTDAVDSLPDTPDGIAQVIRDAGIKGKPTLPSDCPLARWLTEQVGKPISVGLRGATAVGFADWEHVNLPEPARDFIYQFDSSSNPWSDLVDQT